MVCAGPVWAYTGKVVLQVVPPFVVYCRVEPVGQGVPPGAVMLPPLTTQPVVQVLLTMVTFAGAAVKVGQPGQVPGTVVTELVGLEVAGLALQLQRVKTVCAGPDWAYVGTVVLQVAPALVEYCKVEPIGQVPTGAEIEPPDGEPPKVVQVLFVTCAEIGRAHV